MRESPIQSGRYDHPRYYIAHPSDGVWEVGDRSNRNDQVCECTSKAKAVRVWSALIAADGGDDSDLAALENESLRESLAFAEVACLELELQIVEARDTLERAAAARDAMNEALIGHRAPACPPEKRKAKR